MGVWVGLMRLHRSSLIELSEPSTRNNKGGA